MTWCVILYSNSFFMQSVTILDEKLQKSILREKLKETVNGNLSACSGEKIAKESTQLGQTLEDKSRDEQVLGSSFR